jgi:hypothetical protein
MHLITEVWWIAAIGTYDLTVHARFNAAIRHHAHEACPGRWHTSTLRPMWRRFASGHATF